MEQEQYFRKTILYNKDTTGKTLRKPGLEGNFLNLIKNTYKKPIVNIILKGKKLEVFPLRSGTRQACSLPPNLFSNIGEVLANAVRKGIIGLQTGKEEIKLSLFEDTTVRKEKETPYATFSFSFVCRKRVRLWSCSVSTPSSWEYWCIFSRSCCCVSATMVASLTLK